MSVLEVILLSRSDSTDENELGEALRTVGDLLTMLLMLLAVHADVERNDEQANTAHNAALVYLVMMDGWMLMRYISLGFLLRNN